MTSRLALAAALLPLVGSACTLQGIRLSGSGVPSEVERRPGAFRSVESRGSIDLSVSVGRPRRVVVRGDDNLLEYVTTEIDGDRLVVQLEPGSYFLKSPLVVTIHTPELRALEILGSGDAVIEGLDQDALAITVTGSGDVRAAGRVRRLEAGVTGSGDLDLRELRAREIDVEISGSGDARLHAEESLTASVHGSGDVDYWGEPPRIDVETHGSGEVRSH